MNQTVTSSRRLRLALPLLAIVLLTTLAACGKNGEPVLPGNVSGNPENDHDNYKQRYPTSTAPQQGVFN